MGADDGSEFHDDSYFCGQISIAAIKEEEPKKLPTI